MRFIAVTRDPAEAVQAFAREHPMKAWIGLDPDGVVTSAFRIRGIPHVVVIDPYGRVRHRVSTSFFYASDIEDALETKPPSGAPGPQHRT